MIAKLQKELRFEAAHQLPNHEGKCRHPHGHSYRVLIVVEGVIKEADGASDEGMVMDFGFFGTLRDMLDHQDLNGALGSVIGPTTAENIAGWFARAIRRERPDLLLITVTVYETSTSSATVSA